MIKRAVISVLTISTLFAFLQSSAAFAEGVDFSIDVSRAALQLTVPDAVNISLDPTSSVADFDSTTINISVSTNSAAGYTLTMSPTSTTLSGTTSAAIETLAENAEGYTEQSFTVNKWGYRILNNENYKAVPAVLSPEEWVTTGPANLSTKTLTLAAKVDGSQPADIYTTTLNFQVVANPNSPKDTIVFNGNGADSGSMASQFAYQGEPTKLNANAFIRDGYAFNGWNTAANGLGVGYGDGEDYAPAVSDSAKTVTLYAQWICDSSVNTCENVPSIDGSTGTAGRTLQAAFEQAYVNNPGQFPKDEGGYKHGLYVPHKNAQGEYDGTYFEATKQSDYDGIPAKDLRFAIQDIDLKVDGKEVCERTTVIGSEAYVLDLRDYSSYWIAKLADGNCWMTENLDLDLDSTKDYTNEDTDIGWNGTEYTATTWRPSSSTAHSKSSYVNSSNTPQSLDLGDYYYDGTFTYSTCDIVQGGCGYSANMSSAMREHGHIGNHYNTAAANATNNTSQVVLSETDRSICPKGWRLPRYVPSSSTYEITTLYQAYGLGSPGGTGVLFRAPLYFVTAGVPSADIGGGNMGWYRYGSFGNSGGIIIILYNGTMPWGGGNYFEQSISVRCIAR